jgi:hypothetical protein
MIKILLKKITIKDSNFNECKDEDLFELRNINFLKRAKINKDNMEENFIFLIFKDVNNY